ncbi:aldehyde dehydrogenase family protein [Auritidibacter ignavus]|uniref:aldehyde dehydrogenase family protein n=1 Tax=Auritidibacter ignavus TaxID=678932 RepID=UPI002FE5E5C9
MSPSQDPITDESVQAWAQSLAQTTQQPLPTILQTLATDTDREVFSELLHRVIRPDDPGETVDAITELRSRPRQGWPENVEAALKTAARFARRAPGYARNQIINVMAEGLDAVIDTPQTEPTPGADLQIMEASVLGRSQAAKRVERLRVLLDRPAWGSVTVPLAEVLAPAPHWAFKETIRDLETVLGPLLELLASTNRAEASEHPDDTWEPRAVFLKIQYDCQLTVLEHLVLNLCERQELRGLVLGLDLPTPFDTTSSTQLTELHQRFATVLQRVYTATGHRAVIRLNTADHRALSGAQQSYALWSAWIQHVMTPEIMERADLRIRVVNPWDTQQLHRMAELYDLEARLHPGGSVTTELMRGVPAELVEHLQAEHHRVRRYGLLVWQTDTRLIIRALYHRILHGDVAAGLDQQPLNGPYFGFQTRPVYPHQDSLQQLRAGRQILACLPDSQLGTPSVTAHTLNTPDDVRAVVDRAVAAQRPDQQDQHPEPDVLSHLSERVAVVDELIATMDTQRDQLLEVLCSETGRTLTDAVEEYGDAIDAVRWNQTVAQQLPALRGARPVAATPTLLLSGRSHPLVEVFGVATAIYLTGGGCVISPDPLTARTTAVSVDILQRTLAERLVDFAVVRAGDEDFLGRVLCTDPRWATVVHFGPDTAAHRLRIMKPDMPLISGFSSKNAMIITPTADIDQAVADVVTSAFTTAGQTPASCSLVVLVGSMTGSARFKNQLVDATESLEIGYPTDPRVHLGRLVEPPATPLNRGLRELGPGESWWLAPAEQDSTGRLYSPGLRAGVRVGSDAHISEYRGPVLSIMEADTVEDAIEIINMTPYGLSAGIHTADEHSQRVFREKIHAPIHFYNAPINRIRPGILGLTGVKHSASGMLGALGARSWLNQFMTWHDAARTTPQSQPSALVSALAGLPTAVQRLLAAAEADGVASDWVSEAARSDARELKTLLGTHQVASPAGLPRQRRIIVEAWAEPTPVTIRWETGPLQHLLRVVAAGLAIGATMTVSVPHDLPEQLRQLLDLDSTVTYRCEDASSFRRSLQKQPAPERATASGRLIPQITAEPRIRLITDHSTPEAQAHGNQLASAILHARGAEAPVTLVHRPVVSASRLEMMPFVHEKSSLSSREVREN